MDFLDLFFNNFFIFINISNFGQIFIIVFIYIIF